MQIKSMKEEAILKINKVGKFGDVFTLIIKIFLGIGIVGSLIGFIAMLVLPEDFINVKLRGKAEVYSNLAVFNVNFSDNKKEEIRNEIMDGSFDVNEDNYVINNVEVGDSSIIIDAGAEIGTIKTRSIAASIGIAIVYEVLTMITFIFIGRLCKAFRYCETPFSEDVIKKMNQLAVSLVPWIVVGSLAKILILATIKSSSRVVLSLNFSAVLAVVIILMISYIFKYGAILQQESDETI